MFKKIQFCVLLVASCYWLTLPFVPCAQAQQTLGGITGAVTDKSGGALADTTVTIVSEQTTLSRTQKTNGTGTYDFVNLPIGTYNITFTREGFQTQTVPSILVQANRTATINVTLDVRKGSYDHYRERESSVERDRHDERLCAGQIADRVDPFTNRKFHGISRFFTGR